MKVMKKILTMLFVMMMVLGMGTAVSAAEGTSSDTDGKITISNAINGQAYSIYKIFDLESFYDDDPTSSTGTKRYAYKVNSNWNNFITAGEGSTYFDVDENGYVTVKTSADLKEFSQKALAYAKDTANGITATTTKDATGATVEFTGLGLGYYLVDSSVGTLCNLTTTNKVVEIKDKNGVPTVEKKVNNGTSFVEENSATVGDKVEFKTTITAQAGAENYVLYDKMDLGLTLDKTTIKVVRGTTILTSPTDYEVSYPTTSDDWTFKIDFKKDYLDRLSADIVSNPTIAEKDIVVTYSAKLNKNAIVDTTGNKNNTWLKYGDDKKATTTPTVTKTYSIPVFKYYKDASSAQQPLAGVTFTLTKKDTTTAIEFVEVTPAPTGTEKTYRVKEDEAATTINLVTDSTGKLSIQGLAAGTYELKEISAPAGYNIPTKPLEINITSDGKVQLKDNAGAWSTITTTEVQIENKTGTILPSTGGMGTTIMYIVGAALLIGSGVVLVTKKNAK